MLKLSKEISNTIWIVLGRVNSIFSGIVLTAILVRVFSIQEYGHFSMAINVIAIGSVFGSLGLNTSFIKLMNSDRYNANSLIKLCEKIQTYSYLCVIAVIIVFKDHLIDQVFDKELMILTLSLMFKQYELIKCYFDGKLKSKSYQKIEVSIIFIMLVFKAFSAFFAGVYLLCICFVVENLLLYVFLKKRIKQEVEYNLNSKTDINVIDILKQSLPVIIPGVIYMIYTRIDQFMIYNLLTSEEQALYSAAIKVSEGWYFIPLAFVTSYYSSMSTTYGKEEYRKVILKASLVLSRLTLSVAIIITLLSEEIISLLYGNNYLPASNVLILHVWIGVIIAHSSISFRHLIISNSVFISARRAVIGLVVNILLNLILIPSHGIEGAAISTLISQFIALFLSNLIWKETRFIFFIQLKSLLCIK